MTDGDYRNPVLTAESVELHDPSDDAAGASSYCVECGSWGAHAMECLCCGYDFRASASKSASSDF